MFSQFPNYRKLKETQLFHVRKFYTRKLFDTHVFMDLIKNVYEQTNRVKTSGPVVIFARGEI